MSIEQIAISVGLGVFYGGQAALYGYLADNDLPQSWSVILTKKFWESFDPVKAAKTVALGALLGGLGAFNALNIIGGAEGVIVTNFVSSIIVLGVDKFVKFLVRRTPIVRAWNWLKAKAEALIP